MSRCSVYSRLHRLINESVRSYTEAEGVPLTKEKERELLASLSQVLKQIQLWTRELDRDSGDESRTQSEDHHYLSNIIAGLIFLLTIKSQYVQHLSGNILVVFSEYLVISGSYWDFWIHSLCLCMELSITAAFPFPSTSLTTGLSSSCFDLSSFLLVLKPGLKNAGWSTLAGIVRVLRSILKWLKQEYDGDDNLVKVYLDSVHCCLTNLPWDSMDMIYGSENICFEDALDLKNLDEEQSRVVFLGNFLQLLCSLVEQSGSVSDVGHSPDEHPILCAITNLLPKLLYWCLGKPGEHVKTCISQYFKHKLLVLMIRLSFQICLHCGILVSWLQLLHDYFEELLCQPIIALKSVQNDCLEGSPFLLSDSDGEVHIKCSHHLQRQAVFLFLRCSFILISLREDTKKHCVCATTDSCLTLNKELDCIGVDKGLLELYKWLQGHLPVDMFVDYEMYEEKCKKFSLLFLQLYTHEDDVLFKVLLQLLDVPFHADQKFDKRKWTSQDVKKKIFFHVSNIFNPVHLFHLFLAELHYDHQVLLDYLISKDTGIDCVEYLLRCLRLVCDTWPLFMEFSPVGEVANHSSDKRRKVVFDSSNYQGELPPANTKNILPSLEEERKGDLEYVYKLYVTRGSHYKEAKHCLHSLKTSVENLHRKNLFLYNPEVLLKRLMRFQELCSKQDDCDNRNGGPT